MASKVTTKRTSIRFPKRVEIKVGIIDGDARYEDGTSVGEIAEKHEFGLGVPERSWMRGWFDEHSGAIKDTARDYLKDAAEGHRTFESAAIVVAAAARGSIKKRITDGAALLPITSPVTIASKKERGFNPPYTPLFETSLLLSAITATSEVKQ